MVEPKKKSGGYSFCDDWLRFDSSLVEHDSPLGRNPHNMIKRTIEEFEIKRRLAKTKLESYYNNSY